MIARDNRDSALAERRRRETDGMIFRDPEVEPAFPLMPEMEESAQVLDLGDSGMTVLEEERAAGRRG